MLISMVIPSLNQGQFLEDAIKSLLNQKDVSLQIALVDGGAKDQTREILPLFITINVTTYAHTPIMDKLLPLMRRFQGLQLQST